MKSTIPGKQNNFISYLIILIAFFILFFITKSFYSDYMMQREEKISLMKENSEKEKELKRLDTLKSELNNPNSKVLQDIQGLTGDVSPEEIMNYIYSYAQEVNLGSERMIIKTLDVTLGEATDFWFQKAKINIDALFSSEKTLLSFLDAMIDPKNPYRFYIEDLNYPLGNASQTLQVSIPLIFYYSK